MIEVGSGVSPDAILFAVWKYLLLLLATSLLCAESLTIRNVTVIDVDGSRPNQTVTIAGGRITSVAPSGRAATKSAIDGRGKFLIPSLWDMHVHLGRAIRCRTCMLRPASSVFVTWAAISIAQRSFGPRSQPASSSDLASIRRVRHSMASHPASRSFPYSCAPTRKLPDRRWIRWSAPLPIS